MVDVFILRTVVVIFTLVLIGWGGDGDEGLFEQGDVTSFIFTQLACQLVLSVTFSAIPTKRFYLIPSIKFIPSHGGSSIRSPGETFPQFSLQFLSIIIKCLGVYIVPS